MTTYPPSPHTHSPYPRIHTLNLAHTHTIHTCPLHPQADHDMAKRHFGEALKYDPEHSGAKKEFSKVRRAGPGGTTFRFAVGPHSGRPGFTRISY